jgi:hypothetical protein
MPNKVIISETTTAATAAAAAAAAATKADVHAACVQLRPELRAQLHQSLQES